MKNLKYLLLVCIWLHFAAGAFAQSNPLFDYNGILQLQVKHLPSTVNNNVWTRILEAYPSPISVTWIAPWLGISHTIKDKKVICSPDNKNPNISIDKCKSSMIFLDSLDAKLVTYKGNWSGCDSKELYVFHQHKVHEIYLWIAQQEDWLTNITKPENIQAGNYQQSYAPKNNSPKNNFNFTLNEAQEITYLKAEYITNTVHIIWEFSTGKNNNTVLKIEQDCQLTNDKK